MPGFGTYNISFHSGVKTHRSHPGTNSSVSGNFTHFYAAGTCSFREWDDHIAALAAAKAVSDLISEAATVVFSSFSTHVFLQLMTPLGTPNNNGSQHIFQEHTIYLGVTNKQPVVEKSWLNAGATFGTVAGLRKTMFYSCQVV